MKKVLLCLAVFCLSALPLMASDIIIGNPPDSGAGNCFPFGCAYNAEYQQVYGASDFNTGPIMINSLHLYNTQYNSGATQTDAGTFTIELGYTTLGINNITGNFAGNFNDGAPTTVFSGSINQAWQFGNTLNITFSQGFNYDPTKGNLLLDVVGQNVTTPGGNIYYDVNSTGGYFSRVYCSGGVACGNNGTVQNGFGWVTGFDYTGVPEPGTLVMFGTGLVGVIGAIRRRIL